ncbi:MAG: hypothetical protein ACJ8AD_16465, partial [Gemmatimonadaceae bacterium]
MKEKAVPPSSSDRSRTPLGQYTESPAASAPTSGGGEPALRHARAAIATLFGAPPGRPFDVRYWDGSVEHGTESAPYALCINRPGSLRRMLLPPSELAIVEAYISGDVDIDGELVAAVDLGDAINERLRSPRTLTSLVRHLLALPAREPAPQA